MRTILALAIALAALYPTPAQSDWIGNWGETILGEEAYVTAMATDEAGYVYVTGDFWGTISIAGGPELTSSLQAVFVARLSPWSMSGSKSVGLAKLGSCLGLIASISFPHSGGKG